MKSDRGFVFLVALFLITCVGVSVFITKTTPYVTVEDFPHSITQTTTETSTTIPTTSIETQPTSTSEKININTATKEQLTTLSGIGDVIAQRIIDYRDLNEGFLSIEELMEVSGIGEKKFEKIKEFITI